MENNQLTIWEMSILAPDEPEDLDLWQAIYDEDHEWSVVSIDLP